MGASPVLDFTVKSSIHDYEVKFIENVPDIIKNEIHMGDVIIIDNKVRDLYPNLLENITTDNFIYRVNFLESNLSNRYIFCFGFQIYSGKNVCKIVGMNLSPRQQ